MSERLFIIIYLNIVCHLYLSKHCQPHLWEKGEERDTGGKTRLFHLVITRLSPWQPRKVEIQDFPVLSGFPVLSQPIKKSRRLKVHSFYQQLHLEGSYIPWKAILSLQTSQKIAMKISLDANSASMCTIACNFIAAIWKYISSLFMHIYSGMDCDYKLYCLL